MYAAVSIPALQWAARKVCKGASIKVPTSVNSTV